MKEILNKIVDCLALITQNANVYSRELCSEIEELNKMVNDMEHSDEEK